MQNNPFTDEALASLVEMKRGFDALMAFTDSTALYMKAVPKPTPADEMSYLALGLAGEAGESVDCIKKMLRAKMVMTHGVEYYHYCAKQSTKLHQELGDVFWYWIRLCYASGLDPVMILQGMVLKLSERETAGTLAVREVSE